MRTLDTSEQLDARQVWMELQLRESWHDDAQAASCARTPRYYILQNGQVRETDFAAWAAWAYIRLPDRRIRHTLIGQVHVETWFLAFDQGYIGDVPPILFETIVQGEPVNGSSARYTTMQDALAGHEVIVEGVKRTRLNAAN
jgi:hypothetical protein